VIGVFVMVQLYIKYPSRGTLLNNYTKWDDPSNRTMETVGWLGNKLGHPAAQKMPMISWVLKV
jgi:hypothetical protein